jgi:hypothetical protein
MVEEKDGTYVERLIEDSKVPFFINATICLKEGVTLRDLFCLLMKNVDFFSKWCPLIRELYDDMCSEVVVHEERLVALELKRITQIGTNIANERFDFYGHIQGGEVAIESHPVSFLADVPLILNESYEIIDSQLDKLLGGVVRQFTLIELIEGVLCELTFFGSPENRDYEAKKLQNLMEKLDKGEVKTYSFSEIEKRMKRETKETKFPCRICRKDYRCACFGKPSDVCHSCFMKLKEN